MEYSFDIDVAKAYGVNEAILIKNLQFWIMKNRAEHKNENTGRTWTYNTIQGFASLFPFWTIHQVRYTLDSLEKQGVIITGNYNRTAYDRTKWYAFSDESKWFTGCIDLGKIEHESAESVRPIPDINTDTNTNINTDTENQPITTPTDPKADSNPEAFPSPTGSGVVRDIAVKKQPQLLAHYLQSTALPDASAGAKEIVEVEKAYFDNYERLTGKPPVYSYPKNRALLKKRLKEIGKAEILRALRIAEHDDWIVANGYALSTILAEKMLGKLRATRDEWSVPDYKPPVDKPEEAATPEEAKEIFGAMFRKLGGKA